jgi:osomolarity two-component system response regulator SKN7
MHHPHHSHQTTTSNPYPRRSPSPTYTTSTTTTTTPNPFHHLKQEITELRSRLANVESNFKTRLNNLESNYENRLHTLESGLENRLRGLEMGYEGRMRGLEKNYESVLVELVGFQRGVAQQDGVVKSLIRCFLGEDSEYFFLLSSFVAIIFVSFTRFLSLFLYKLKRVANIIPSFFFSRAVT